MDITINGVIKDPSGAVPVSGSVKCTLSEWYFDAQGQTRTPTEERALVDTDGNFAIVLQSTTDGTPSDRNYHAIFHGTVRGQGVTIDFGTFALSPAPSTQNFDDLIAAGLPPAAILGTPVYMVSPAAGVCDGNNNTFTLPDTPIRTSVMGYIKLPGSGLLLRHEARRRSRRRFHGHRRRLPAGSQADGGYRCSVLLSEGINHESDLDKAPSSRNDH